MDSARTGNDRTDTLGLHNTPDKKGYARYWCNNWFQGKKMAAVHAKGSEHYNPKCFGKGMELTSCGSETRSQEVKLTRKERNTWNPLSLFQMTLEGYWLLLFGYLSKSFGHRSRTYIIHTWPDCPEHDLHAITTNTGLYTIPNAAVWDSW